MSIIEGALLLVAAGTSIVTMLWLVPLIARARVGAQAVRVRNDVMDAVLDGWIDPDDPALANFLSFTAAYAEHAGRLGLSEAWCAHKAVEKYGTTASEIRERVTYARMNEQGRRVMHAAEAHMNRAVGDYLFAGSRLWFVLVPLRWVGRIVPTNSDSPVDRFRPTHLASDIREASSTTPLKPLVSM